MKITIAHSLLEFPSISLAEYSPPSFKCRVGSRRSYALFIVSFGSDIQRNCFSAAHRLMAEPTPIASYRRKPDSC